MKPGAQAIVGGVVLGGVALRLGEVGVVGNFSLVNPSVQAAVVFQGSIAGLSVGAPVTFRGVRVGAVETVGIDFDPKTEVAYIPVIVRLTPNQAAGTRQAGVGAADLPGLITRGLRAELNVQRFGTGTSKNKPECGTT